MNPWIVGLSLYRVKFDNVIRCCEVAINNKSYIVEDTIASEYNTNRASRVVTNLVTSLTELVRDEWSKSYI